MVKNNQYREFDLRKIKFRQLEKKEEDILYLPNKESSHSK
jgi:hypothetical protein